MPKSQRSNKLAVRTHTDRQRESLMGPILHVLLRDEIKSLGKFAIRSSFKIARTPSLPPSILNTEFPNPNLLNNTPYNVSK